jgi:hypothetical protein
MLSNYVIPDILAVIASYFYVDDYYKYFSNEARTNEAKPNEEKLNEVIPTVPINKYIYHAKKYIDEIKINIIAGYGSLEIIKYLISIGKECTTDAMDHASWKGHLEIVKYLHSIGKDCTVSAMNLASREGHLEVVKYLHSIGKDCTTRAMD